MPSQGAQQGAIHTGPGLYQLLQESGICLHDPNDRRLSGGRLQTLTGYQENADRPGIRDNSTDDDPENAAALPENPGYHAAVV